MKTINLKKIAFAGAALIGLVTKIQNLLLFKQHQAKSRSLKAQLLRNLELDTRVLRSILLT